MFYHRSSAGLNQTFTTSQRLSWSQSFKPSLHPNDSQRLFHAYLHFVKRHSTMRIAFTLPTFFAFFLLSVVVAAPTGGASGGSNAPSQPQGSSQEQDTHYKNMAVKSAELWADHTSRAEALRNGPQGPTTDAQIKRHEGEAQDAQNAGIAYYNKLSNNGQNSGQNTGQTNRKFTIGP
jgi:hypothetical protein